MLDGGHGNPDPVLLVEADRASRMALTAALARLNLRARAVERAEEAVALAGEQQFLAVFLDQSIADGLVPALLSADPRLPLVVTDRRPSIEAAVRAIKTGAASYLSKPARRNRIRAFMDGLSAVRKDPGSLPASWRLLSTTRCPAMREVIGQLEFAAGSDVPVLLRGETGTGKSAFAQGIHHLSPRRAKPLVTISCPCLSPELLMAELFGHTRGAFTNATTDAVGKVEMADGGTLLLDEIGELSLDIQARLLRFIQERAYERVGDPTSRRADVRIIASTSRDLLLDTQRGRFRADLFYRLAVVEAAIPPLRERPEDIVALGRHFMLAAAAESGRPALPFTPAAEAALLGYGWPGNLREMRNEIQRALAFCTGEALDTRDLTPRLLSASGSAIRLGGPFSLAAVSYEHIRQVVDHAPTLDAAAKTLRIQPSTLWRKRRELAQRGAAERPDACHSTLQRG